MQGTVEYYTIYLSMKAPFQNGFPRSDTLFGGICHAVRCLYGEDALKKILNNDICPFVLSSVFPMLLNGSEKIHLFPMPLFYEIDLQNVNLELTPFIIEEAVRNLKGIVWVTEKIFNSYLSGELKFMDLLLEMGGRRKTLKLINGILAYADEQILVNEYYYQESFRNSLCFFLLQISDKNIENMILSSIRFLGDAGLGKNASRGGGTFSVIEDRANKMIRKIEDPDFYVTLSLLFPDDNLYIKALPLGYKTEIRQGWVNPVFTRSGSLPKKALIMFKEGSCIKFNENNNVIAGSNPVVAESDFKVLHHGTGFLVGARK